ncbi:MAG TPA: tetratricopeptide repeat protein [Steroidobacteraceae bacterium]|nr:tetratricopeptide repeat protein [Steroidobacteraceae bacterium]
MMRRAPWAMAAALALVGFLSHAQQAPAGYSASSLYNTANAYARANQPGLAVLNYERALLLEPNDPDIAANLRHVRLASGLPPESRTGFERAARSLNPRILAWAGIAGLALAGAAVLARRAYPGHRRKLLAAAAAGFLVLGVALANAWALWPALHEAVVVAHAAPLRVSPVALEESKVSLPEATIVRAGAEHDGFVLVQVPGGRTGWVPEADLAALLPKPRQPRLGGR